MAFDHSSLRWFGAFTCMTALRGLPSSSAQHGCSLRSQFSNSSLRLRGAQSSAYRQNACPLFSSRHGHLACDFCSSGQRITCGFLQIPPRCGHPCRPANSSPCRACRGLSPPSERSLPGAHKKSPSTAWLLNYGALNVDQTERKGCVRVWLCWFLRILHCHRQLELGAQGVDFGNHPVPDVSIACSESHRRNVG